MLTLEMAKLPALCFSYPPVLRYECVVTLCTHSFRFVVKKDEERHTWIDGIKILICCIRGIHIGLVGVPEYERYE